MKKLFFSFILFFTFTITCFCQTSLITEMIEEELKIRQKEGTNKLLKDYLSSLNTNSDTIYAILFRPSNCIRCEARIPYFTQHLPLLYPDTETVLISVYEDAEAAAHYIKKNNYHTDHYIFDTEQKMDDIFSLNTDGLYSVYILKIDKENGYMIVGGDPFHMGKDFIHEIYAYSELLPYHTFETEEDYTSDMNEEEIKYPLLSYETYIVNADSDYPISGVYEYPILKDTIFVYSDELGNAAYQFTIDQTTKEINFTRAIVADSLEKMMYADIPYEEFEKRKNGIYYIAMDVKLIDDKNIGISYSLPWLVMESPTNMIYYNKEIILVRDKETSEKKPCIPLDFDILNETYMYSHFTFYPIGNDQILIGCKKLTWPIEFDPEDYQGIKELDSFMEEFYETDNPYFALFDKVTGKLIQRFGQLDIAQRLTRTGYYYSNPIASYHKDKIIYGNGYMGKLYIANQGDPTQIEKEISVFDIDINNLPAPDPDSFYKLEYAKPYDRYFSRCIESVILTDNTITCLLRNGNPHDNTIQKNHYEYISIDRTSNEVLEWYPLVKDPHADNERILVFGLAQHGENITPYYFAKNGKQAYINYMYK